MHSRRLLTPLPLFVLGLALGTASRLFDLYFQNLGNIFSQMAIWILLGTLISIYSPTPKRAALNLPPFCLGMLLTYYATAMLTHGVYSPSFILGWTVFALLTPVMAYFAWMTKEKGLLARLIGAGIVLVSVLSSLLLFDRLRIYDFIIDALLIYVIFFKRVSRPCRRRRERA